MNDRTWELLEKHLESGCYFIVSSQDTAPSVADLRAVAIELGCEFPDEFLAHSSNKYGGLYVEVNEDLWPRPKEFDVGPFWSFLYGLFTYNSADEIPEFMDIRANGRTFQEETGHTAVPFLKIIGDADVYCFDQTGQIVRWSHEEDILEPVNRSFFDLLDDELRELAERKERKVNLGSP